MKKHFLNRALRIGRCGKPHEHLTSGKTVTWRKTSLCLLWGSHCRKTDLIFWSHLAKNSKITFFLHEIAWRSCFKCWLLTLLTESFLSLPSAHKKKTCSCSVLQALLIYLFVELLQKCQVVQLDSLKVSSQTIPNPMCFLGTCCNLRSIVSTNKADVETWSRHTFHIFLNVCVEGYVQHCVTV